MKILIIDIETRPSLAYVWGVWEQNVRPAQLVEETEVICFAAKWYGESETYFHAITGGKARMIKNAWKMLDQADVVVGYNSTKFDIKHLNREFIEAGLKPPTPFRNVDLLTTVKRKFKWNHNKLDSVARTVLGERKVEHEGFDLWIRCMQGEKAAWAKMREYNVGDVLLTERLYTELLPWIDNHPSHAAYHGDMRCTNCGGTNLRSKGYRYAKTYKYRRYVCKGCGTYISDRKNDGSTSVVQTASW